MKENIEKLDKPNYIFEQCIFLKKIKNEKKNLLFFKKIKTKNSFNNLFFLFLIHVI